MTTTTQRKSTSPPPSTAVPPPSIAFQQWDNALFGTHSSCSDHLFEDGTSRSGDSDFNLHNLADEEHAQSSEQHSIISDGLLRTDKGKGFSNFDYSSSDNNNKRKKRDDNEGFVEETKEKFMANIATARYHYSTFTTPIKIVALFVLLLFINLAFVVYLTAFPAQSGEQRNSLMLTSNKFDDRLPGVNWRPLPKPEETITRIAFGSASSQNMPQPYWDTLIDYRPDLFIMAGDNIYADCLEDDGDECDELYNGYYDWAKHASFSGATERISVIATMDDMDYGQLYGYNTNTRKEEAKWAFINFFHDVVHPDLLTRKNDGVYQEFVWGPIGRRVQVIMLDTRYNRSAFNAKTTTTVNEDETQTETITFEPWHFQTILDSKIPTPLSMLGDAQWTWFEQQLDKPDIDLRLIVSPMQVINDVTSGEAWRMIPSERDTLYFWLREYSATPTLLLSGGSDVGSIYNTVEADIFEITSSSLTHTTPCAIDAKKSPDGVYCPFTDETDARRRMSAVHVNNFGSIDIDWSNRKYTASLRRAERLPGKILRKPESIEDGTSGDTDEAGQVIQEIEFNLNAL